MENVQKKSTLKSDKKACIDNDAILPENTYLYIK